MEEKDEERIRRDLLLKSLVATGIASILTAVILPGLGSMMYIVPILVLVGRTGERRKSLLLLLAVFIILATVRLVEYWGYPTVLAVNIAIPLLPAAAAAIWIATSGKNASYMRRLFLTCIPVVVLSIAGAITVKAGLLDGVLDAYKELLGSYIGLSEELEGIDIESTVFVVRQMLIYGMVPVGMLLSGFGILLSELIQYRRLAWWQNEMACMKTPPLLNGLSVGLLIVVVAAAKWYNPSELGLVVAFNLMVGLLMLAGIHGYSVLLSLLRKWKPGFGAGLLIVLLILLSVVCAEIPFLSYMFLGLPLLAVADTLFKIR